MKILYSDVFIGGLDQTMTGLLCQSGSNGMTFTVSGNEILLPPCALNKSENIGNIKITEISRERDFINVYGYSDDDSLLIIRAHSVVLNKNHCRWASLSLEAGLEWEEDNYMTNVPGIFAVESHSGRDWQALSSEINKYLLSCENQVSLRA